MGLRNLTVNAGNWNVEERTGYVDLSIENTYKGNEGHEFSVGMTFKVCADGVLLQYRDNSGNIRSSVA